MSIVGRRVVLLKENKLFGYVLSEVVDFDKKQLSGYIIVESETEQEYYAPYESIISSCDFVVVNSFDQLEGFYSKYEERKQVLSQDGFDFGLVKKFCFKKNMLEKIITDRCEISPRYIVSTGDNVIFVSFKNRKRFPRGKNETGKVIALAEIKNPTRAELSDVAFKGKIASKTLIGLNKEIVVKEGEKITKQIIEKAKTHNMLNELFFISKIDK